MRGIRLLAIIFMTIAIMSYGDNAMIAEAIGFFALFTIPTAIGYYFLRKLEKRNEKT